MKNRVLRWCALWVAISIIFTVTLELFVPKFSSNSFGFAGSLLSFLVLTFPIFIVGWQIVGLLEHTTTLQGKLKPIAGFVITLFLTWVFYSVVFMDL